MIYDGQLEYCKIELIRILNPINPIILCPRFPEIRKHLLKYIKVRVVLLVRHNSIFFNNTKKLIHKH